MQRPATPAGQRLGLCTPAYTEHLCQRTVQELPAAPLGGELPAALAPAQEQGAVFSGMARRHYSSEPLAPEAARLMTCGLGFAGPHAQVEPASAAVRVCQEQCPRCCTCLGLCHRTGERGKQGPLSVGWQTGGGLS